MRDEGETLPVSAEAFSLGGDQGTAITLRQGLLLKSLKTLLLELELFNDVD
jgi:hypothetical protein